MGGNTCWVLLIWFLFMRYFSLLLGISWTDGIKILMSTIRNYGSRGGGYGGEKWWEIEW